MIGFPRSGTTLLDTILRSHQSIEVIEEKPMVSKLIDSLDVQTFVTGTEKNFFSFLSTKASYLYIN